MMKWLNNVICILNLMLLSESWGKSIYIHIERSLLLFQKIMENMCIFISLMKTMHAYMHTYMHTLKNVY